MFQLEIKKLKDSWRPPRQPKQMNKRKRNNYQDKYSAKSRLDITEEKEILGKKHQLVVIPIFWKKRESEMEEVVEAANEFKQSIVKFKINVWVDKRKSLTPAQKYEYWEQMGCLFRAEIGPREAKNGTVCISKVGTGKKQKSAGRVFESRSVAQRWHNLPWKKSVDLIKVATILKNEGLDYIDLSDINELEDNVIVNSVQGHKKKEYSGDSLEVNYRLD